jgi:phage recombination protein Bet
MAKTDGSDVGAKIGAPPKVETSLMRWEAGGQEIALSFSDVRRYLVSGGGDVTDKEVMMFLEQCKFRGMNPFLREAYLIKYRTQDDKPAQIVTGKDYFTRKAAENPACEGWRAGIIVSKENGEIEEREGMFYLKDKETLVGGWAEVYRTGWHPMKVTVAFDEYQKMRWDSKLKKQVPQSTWASMPATMIRKVPLVQALREAFPEMFGGLYAPEEMDVRMHELDETPVPQEGETYEGVVVDEGEETANEKPDKKALKGFRDTCRLLSGDAQAKLGLKAEEVTKMMVAYVKETFGKAKDSELTVSEWEQLFEWFEDLGEAEEEPVEVDLETGEIITQEKIEEAFDEEITLDIEDS